MSGYAKNSRFYFEVFNFFDRLVNLRKIQVLEER